MPELPDYSALIGKMVRIKDMPPRARCVGRLESWNPIKDSDCIAVRIRRRSGVLSFVSGRFELERVPR